MPELIRVSCNGFANIQLEERVLGLLARSRLPDKRIYSPIGGGVQHCFSEPRLLEEFLAKLGATLEKPETKDLRIKMPESSLNSFTEWFYGERDRELTPQRELEEELCDKEFQGKTPPLVRPVLAEFAKPVIVEMKKATTRGSVKGEATHYFFSVYNTKLTDPSQIRLINELGEKSGRVFCWLSKEEIYAGRNSRDEEVAGDVFKFCYNDFKNTNVLKVTRIN